MRAVVQRVSSSCVKVQEEIVGSINKGFMVLLGISKEDNLQDIDYIVDKITGLRVFEDEDEKMNLSIRDVSGEILLVSQFTLYGDVRRGKRPSFSSALSGDEAVLIYEKVIEELKKRDIKVETGKFGADMKVSIENDGPVTILLDSKKLF